MSHRLIYIQKGDRRCPGKASDRPLIRLILMPSFYPMPDLSTEERLILVKHIKLLMQSDFDALMFALNVPYDVIPPGQAALGNRAIALLQWAKSPTGCGMIEFLKTLDAIAPVPFGVSLDRPTAQGTSNEDFQEKLSHGAVLDMIYIPEGIFLMGSPKNEPDQNNWEGPQHRVAVPSFFVGKYPVTQKQWFIVSTFPKVDVDLSSEPSLFKGDDLPVECVSWNDAVEFCKRLSKRAGREYRLPSESEWEYACRSGTTTAYSFGDSITPGQANFNENVGQTTPLGKYPPNKFGLHDMHGNVWEWCQDIWHENYKGAPTNGSAWVTDRDDELRVIRGGSWYVYPRYCRSATRVYIEADNDDDDVGFRVVCSPPRILQ
ncbi:MAG: formylglycine-generating enzyme family protein [Cyanobacteria bacterium P01_E01_bin.6]